MSLLTQVGFCGVAMLPFGSSDAILKHPLNSLMPPLILTARLDPGAQKFFDQLREQHFPSGRNFLKAHLTLFHALPGDELQLIQAQLTLLSQRQTAMEGVVAKVRSLGNGVAFTIECLPLVSLRAELAALWQIHLTPQDRQAFRPHITVQNKVPAATAQALLHNLEQSFTPRPLRFEGLDLWWYQGGPWDLAAEFSFPVRA